MKSTPLSDSKTSSLIPSAAFFLPLRSYGGLPPSVSTLRANEVSSIDDFASTPHISERSPHGPEGFNRVTFFILPQKEQSVNFSLTYPLGGPLPLSLL